MVLLLRVAVLLLASGTKKLHLGLPPQDLGRGFGPAAIGAAVVLLGCYKRQYRSTAVVPLVAPAVVPLRFRASAASI